MSPESQLAQQRANKLAVPFRPAAPEVELGFVGSNSQYSVHEPGSKAGVSPGSYDRLKAEYLLLTERIQTLEAENASLQMRVQILQELCLLD